MRWGRTQQISAFCASMKAGARVPAPHKRQRCYSTPVSPSTNQGGVGTGAETMNSRLRERPYFKTKLENNQGSTMVLVDFCQLDTD